MALFVDDVLHCVGVHAKGGEPHRVFGFLFVHAIVLGHDIVADHAPGFADIDHIRPAAIALKLIFGQAVTGRLFTNVLGNAFVIAQGPEEPTDVELVLFFNFPALGITCLGVFPVGTDIVATHGMHVVPVHLGSGPSQRLDQGGHALVSSVKNTQQEFVIDLPVALWFLQRHFQGGIFRQAHAVVVSLDLMVTLPIFKAFNLV